MVSRKVPVHRAPRGGGGSAPRTVSRPGVSADGKSAFQSPYQPPPRGSDLAGDVAAMDPNAWQLVHVAGVFWRVRVPTPSALGLLAEILETKGGAQVQTINMFLANHMHPDDLAVMLDRMTDPDDSFDASAYQELYRATVTVGTARPFSQSSPSSGPPPIRGVSSEPSWLSAVWGTRSRR